MRLDKFKSGSFVKRTELISDGPVSYTSFEPCQINGEWQWQDPDINILLEKASGSLQQLNAYDRIVPDFDSYEMMHIYTEATASSAIEGTQTTLDEVVQEKQDYIRPERRSDWKEVRNYIQSLREAIRSLQNTPLSNRTILQAHKVLMKGVRGGDRRIGEFRIHQNMIGQTNSLQEADFIPPHPDSVIPLMSDLELFIHNNQVRIPHLIKSALIHYQFETIHPFDDGNGRIGRLLIILYLLEKQLLRRPVLYISGYLNKRKEEYVQALTHGRQGNIVSWIKFFLAAIIESSNSGSERLEKLLKHKQTVDQTIQGYGARSGNAAKLIGYLYEKPIITMPEARSQLNLSTHATIRLINMLCKDGLLREITGQKRNKEYIFKTYVDMFG